MYRELHIKPVLNGWVVSIGCQKAVFADTSLGRSEMIQAFTEYIHDPKATEKHWLDKALNKDLLAPTPMLRERRLSEENCEETTAPSNN